MARGLHGVFLVVLLTVHPVSAQEHPRLTVEQYHHRLKDMQAQRAAAQQSRRAQSIRTAQCFGAGYRRTEMGSAEAHLERIEINDYTVHERLHLSLYPGTLAAGQVGATAFAFANMEDGGIWGLVNQGGTPVFRAAEVNNPRQKVPFWSKGPITPQRVTIDLGVFDYRVGPAFCSGYPGKAFGVYAGYGRLTPQAQEGLARREQLTAMNQTARVDPALIKGPDLRHKVETALARSQEQASKRAAPAVSTLVGVLGMVRTVVVATQARTAQAALAQTSRPVGAGMFTSGIRLVP